VALMENHDPENRPDGGEKLLHILGDGPGRVPDSSVLTKGA